MEISIEDLAKKSIYVVSIYVGGTKTGKSVFARNVIDEMFRLNIVNEITCWAPEYSISSNGYKLMFTPDNCRSDFKNFNKWFTEYREVCEYKINLANSILNDFATLMGFYELIPKEDQDDMMKRIGIVLFKSRLPMSLENPATKNIFTMVISEYLKMNRDLVRNWHLAEGTCPGGDNPQCLKCLFCNVPRPLIFIDDFIGFSEIMAGEFGDFPTRSRHLMFTIIMLSQYDTSFKPTFRNNTLVDAYTQTKTLECTLGRTNMGAKQIKAYTDKMDSIKKVNRWNVLILDKTTGMMDLLFALPDINAYPVFVYDVGNLSDV